MATQKTLRGTARVRGIGLHTGADVRVEIVPSAVDTGIVFVRTDLPGNPRVAASLENLGRRPRRTALVDGEVEVHTVEHLLATFCAMGIQNAEVRLDGPELPGLDGSALGYYEALQAAGVEEQDRPAREIRLGVPVGVCEDGASATALARADGLRVSYTLDYDSPLVATQYLSVDLDEQTFAREIAPARTFVLLSEVEALRAAGLGKGASTRNTLVVGPEGILENELRFADEFVRHKILDLIGDLYLTASAVSAEVVAARSGHSLNVKLAKAIVDAAAGASASSREAPSSPSSSGDAETAAARGVLESRDIEKILPHRYPFLLVDRVLDVVPGRFARGVKCVSVNEGFFRGHFPGLPVMPGALVVEAMAQLGGILLKSDEKNRECEAYLVSLDGVKFRRPVVPGDRLVLEAEIKRMKPRSAHVSTRALVEGALVSEAEIRYALIPAGHRFDQRGRDES
jgi:UDP-3-O-[3-hydroxymyristoyl] N-acetylglucosamine deacetylase/3-hydroxyacyl-[acyl-carrier-protein] dehydratase